MGMHNLSSASLLVSHLRHEAAGLCVQQLGLGARVQQEGEGAEGEGPVHGHAMIGRVVRLPPCHVVVLHIQLLAAARVQILVDNAAMQQCHSILPHQHELLLPVHESPLLGQLASGGKRQRVLQNSP